MPARRTPKVEALVVNAIRRLQDVQGSTSREISNYISQEYDVPKEDIRRQVRVALERGLSYGILQRSRRYKSESIYSYKSLMAITLNWKF